MTRKQLRDENGQYAGSIGDGKTPPPSDSFRPPTPDLSGSDPVVLVNDVWRVYEKTVAETLLENEVDRLASLRDSGPVAADIVALVRQHDEEQAIQGSNGETAPQGENAQSLWDGLSEPMREQLRDITLAEAEARVHAGIARARAAVSQDSPYADAWEAHEADMDTERHAAAASGEPPSLPLHEIVANSQGGQSFVRDDAHILADVLLVSRIVKESGMHQDIQELREQGRRIVLPLLDEEMTDYIDALTARIDTYPEARIDRTPEQQILWLYHYNMKVSAMLEMQDREQDFYEAGGDPDDF